MQTLTRSEFDSGMMPTSGISRTSCIALIWAQGDLTRRRCAQASVSLRAQPGVESVRPSPRKASLFIVRFDRDWTTAMKIVTNLRNAGFAAVLVGC